MTEKIIRLEQITFAYPGNQPVLEDITLEIETGDFVVILGSNGSAKTTLLQIILGLLKPQKGTVSIGTSQISAPNISYLPQRTTLNPGFPATVREVLELTNKKSSGQNHTQQINTVLKKVELQDKSNSLLGTLSGGQLQRVFIARALFNNPHIIILDEPANNLDVQAQEDLSQLLNNLHQEGLTILTVTHDLHSVLDYASRFLLLDRKKIRELPKENWRVI